MKKQDIHEFFSRLEKERPDPQGELHLSIPTRSLWRWCCPRKATDKGVNKATEPLFKKIKTPEAMVKLGETKLRDAIKTIGLYRNKAKHVIGLSKALIENHNSGRAPIA